MFFAHFCFRNIGRCLPFQLPARGGNRDKLTLVGPPSVSSSLSKTCSEPIGGAGPFPQMFEHISSSFPLLEQYHHISLPGRGFPVCKGPTDVQPLVRDVLMAMLLEEHHCCSPACSHDLLHGRPCRITGSFHRVKTLSKSCLSSRKICKKGALCPLILHRRSDSLDSGFPSGCLFERWVKAKEFVYS